MQLYVKFICDQIKEERESLGSIYTKIEACN